MYLYSRINKYLSMFCSYLVEVLARASYQLPFTSMGELAKLILENRFRLITDDDTSYFFTQVKVIKNELLFFYFKIQFKIILYPIDFTNSMVIRQVFY